MQNRKIDGGKPFDWGRTSDDYANYRDIYPPIFYKKILDLGLCISGQKVLDLGTGTGVLPRHLYSAGAHFTGIDISENQILQARRLAQDGGMDIEFIVSPAEDLAFSPNTFDVVTACQCFFYFDSARVLPQIARMLVPSGKLAIFYMAWLPEEDPIAGESEKLVLRYSPQWSGAGEQRRPIPIPPEAHDLFTLTHSLTFDLRVPFTRESWNGRIKACRGIGASLSSKEISDFEKEHLALLNRIAPPSFEILHYASMAVLEVKK